MNIKKIIFPIFICALSAGANALEYDIDKIKFKLNADGMVGFLTPKDKDAIFINDWEVKVQTLYQINATQRFGLVYSIDAESIEDKEYINDAFVLLEDKTIGRAELGITDSVARKMGLGLPDVGPLRINDDSLLFKKLKLNRVLISDTAIKAGDEAIRLNLATVSSEYGQYGLSVSGHDDTYNYTIDTAFKIKQPFGKLKSAYSFAISYMNKPDNYSENSFSPNVTADWRGQIATGINLQYNSFVWGTSARLIYDRNPKIKTADGLVVGTGLSYDLLRSSLSLTYLFSDTNVWTHNDEFGNEMSGDYINTVIASFRYKYTENTNISMSGGITDTKPFFAVGIKTGF